MQDNATSNKIKSTHFFTYIIVSICFIIQILFYHAKKVRTEKVASQSLRLPKNCIPICQKMKMICKLVMGAPNIAIFVFPSNISINVAFKHLSRHKNSRDFTCLLQRWKIELPDVFLKSVTNHSIQFHFVSKWLAIDILWKSEENQQTSQGSQI